MLRCYKPLSILKVNFFKSTFGGIRAGTNTLDQIGAMVGAWSFVGDSSLSSLAFIRRRYYFKREKTN